MGYSTRLAAYLSGASIAQIRSWARKGILIPEIHPTNPREYSFRDVVALRVIARLRAQHSLQKIRRALDTLDEQALTNHLSEYRFYEDDKEIFVQLPNEDLIMDTTGRPGQLHFTTLEEVFQPFTNFQNRYVPSLENPSPGISVRPDVLGGFPTIENTRVPFDLVVDLADGMDPEEINDYYPTLKPADLDFALQFQQKLEMVA